MSWSLGSVSVRFGATTALDKVSLDVERGVIHAVIGGDGAGKSTLLRVLTGLDIGQTGSIRLPTPERIGFVPSHGGLFTGLTVAENMEFVADAYQLPDWQDRATLLLERATIQRFRDRLVENLSGGQRKKLAGCMALLPEPDLLVLDEVTTGIDPVSRLEIWRLVTNAAARGAAVVAATTYLDEADRAGSVTLLHEGRVIASGTPDEIIASVPGAVADRATPGERATAWRHGSRWRQWEPEGVRHRSLTLEDAAIVHELIAGGSRP